MDVALDLARVECAVEGTEFDGVRGPLGGKGRVQVEQVVAAVVVVAAGAAPPVCARAAAVGAVPKLCQRLHGGRLAAVELGEERRLHRPAPAGAPAGRNAQRLCQKVFLGVDDVHQPAQALRGVLPKADVDVDAAGGVGLRASFAQGADNLLNHLDVLPAAHRADHLGAGVGDRAIALDRPVPPVGHGHLPVAQVPPDVPGRCAEVCRDGACRPLAAETGGLDLNAESLGFHGVSSLLPGGFSRPRRRPVFRPRHIHHSARPK